MICPRSQRHPQQWKVPRPRATCLAFQGSQPPCMLHPCRCSLCMGPVSLYRQRVCMRAQFLACEKAWPTHRQLEVTSTPNDTVQSRHCLAFWFLIDICWQVEINAGWRTMLIRSNYSQRKTFQNNKQNQTKNPKTLVCLRNWIESKRSREVGPALSRGWQVHWGVNCLGVQWVYSDHKQRAFSSRSFKSTCVKGGQGKILY